MSYKGINFNTSEQTYNVYMIYVNLVQRQSIQVSPVPVIMLQEPNSNKGTSTPQVKSKLDNKFMVTLTKLLVLLKEMKITQSIN